MKILMVNKFLYPNGGSETYIFKLGDFLKEQGHEVEYFGMEHKDRVVGNRSNSYTSNMDFRTGKIQKLLYPFKIIYSIEARKKIKAVLQDFKPDVVHLNNFNFQLTPSILYEIKKYNIPIVYTAHDSQLVCPNHLMRNPISGETCTKCFGGKFGNCTKGKCIHGSIIKSFIASIEAYFYKILKTYKMIDVIIVPSEFLKQKLESNPILKNKTIMLHNFIDHVPKTKMIKEEYILYFGRFSEEKGIKTLLEVCKELRDIPFVFAGNGPLEDNVNKIPNIKNIGFQTGKELQGVIAKAKFSVFPSECYENCPFSVMESQLYQTPVIGADLGGIPELILVGKTGELFESRNQHQLKEKILDLWNDSKKCYEYTQNCKDISFDTIDRYAEKLIKIYYQSKQIN